jgi:GNAT superfamily N-acetyltransferase
VLLAIDPAAVAADVRVEDGFPHLYGPLLPDAVFDVAPFPPEDDGSFHLVFAPMPTSAPPASELIEAMLDELEPQYGRIDGAATPSATPSDLWRPGGTYLVGHLDGTPVAGGGVKTLAPGLGEIKRMFVRPETRGRGIARKLLAALEDAARRLGHDRVRLDTGDGQVEALALYRSAGYVAIPDYNGNPHATYWAEKALT